MTQIQKIPIQHVDGQSVVYWDSIEKAFPGAKQVKNGDVAIPRCVKSFPATALTVGLTDTPADLPPDHPSEDKLIEGLQVTSALTETPINDVHAHTSSASSSILPPSSNSEVKATSKTAVSFKHIVLLASKKAKESDPQVQIQELRGEMVQVRLLQKASDAKQEEIEQLRKQAQEQQEVQQKKVIEHLEEMNRMQKQALEQHAEQKKKASEHHEEMRGLQNQALEKQEKMDRLQEEIRQLQIKSQEELKQMHIEVMGQLSVLQFRVQAVLTQTFELHEYPIPRLFIVLPQDPSGWDIVNPFSNKFRLYFLCECGEHTRLANNKTKIPHHIHLAKHEGYEIARPSEFFRQYGVYVLTILKMLKLGITIAGVVMPALSQLISPDVVGQSIDSLKQLQDIILPSVDQVIEWMDKVAMDDAESIGDISTSNGKSVERVTEQMETKEVLEGADLRKLSTFLQGKDGNKVLGNLYRTVTVEGHVKWVCIDHYHENYQDAQLKLSNVHWIW
ncbi:hypothetical protein BGZ98_001575 [Dissophora globulifera]|nr:hypothetical protein BGZ98_001575 [Dissophora globulifera]